MNAEIHRPRRGAATKPATKFDKVKGEMLGELKAGKTVSLEFGLVEKKKWDE